MSHTNLFIVKNARKFFSIKRSLKPIYGLNLSNLSILRYILDSIETNCVKTKELQTHLYQSQIAKYCHCSLKTVGDHIKILIKKKFIIYNSKLSTFSLGKVLITYVNFTYPLDVSKIYVPPRYTKILRTSIDSKFTRKDFKNTKRESGYASVTNQPQVIKSLIKSLKVIKQ